MLSDTFIVGILQASIAGAGLILIVLTLFAPIKEKVFQKRIVELGKLQNDLANHGKQIVEKVSGKVEQKQIDDELERIKKLIENIVENSKIPDYLRFIMIGTFTAFILSAMFCIFWVVQTIESNKLGFEYAIIGLLIAGIIGFLLIGGRIYNDIINIWTGEYEELKKK